MADRFYSIPIGSYGIENVTEGASTSGAAVELRVNDSAYSDRQLVLLAVEQIEQYIETQETTPIA